MTGIKFAFMSIVILIIIAITGYQAAESIHAVDPHHTILESVVDKDIDKGL